MIPIGTLVNIGTVLLGGIIGLIFKKIINPEINKKIFFVMGLFTLILGFSMATQTNSFIIMLVSLVIGTLLGEYYNLDLLMTRGIESFKKKINLKDEKFAEGFLTAFLLYCIGSMTIVGAIDEGLGRPPQILYTKAIMDGISSIILASAFGSGVLFSVFPMLIFQGGITMLVFINKTIFPTELIDHISCLGGCLIIAIGLKILGYQKLNPTNMLPSLLIIALAYFLQLKIGL